MFTPGHREPGGAARRSRLLASALAARGWDVRVVTRAGTLFRPAVTRSSNLTVIEIPGFRSRRLGAVLFLTGAIPLGLLWGTRARALIAIQLASPSTAAALCSIGLRRPYIALATTSGRLSETAYVTNQRFAGVRRWLLGRAAFVGAQTDAVASELAQLVDEERVVVVPNPVERVVPPPLSGAPRALYTGRLSEEKDLVRLLEAWRVIAAENSGALLTLAGSGGGYRSVEDELHRLVSSDPVLTASVRFTGWVADVRPLLAESDLYVFPSLSEGMSNALLEACAWHRVVVASDIPSNCALLGDDYPLLFKAGDTVSLVETVQRALNDEEARVQALACLATRIGPYFVDGVVTRLEELLALAGSSSRSGGRN
ncbi:MAG TPA: glycosyltransferase family 4 protein [Acidimicrobiales bacterium]|nr:glycosyltransferase family 4 protein [Acidimicrobiales bacterium]